MKHKVMCVDDQKGIRMLLKEILKDDYKVKTARTGKEAIQTSKDFKPDVILLDMCLGDMRGTDVLDEIKSRDSDVKVIMITGNEEKFITEELKQFKPEYIIRKPFDITTIQTKMQYLTQESQFKQVCV